MGRDLRESLRALSREERNALLQALQQLCQEEVGTQSPSWEESLDTRKANPGNERPRVVITGIGAITPLALNAHETWQKLVAGESGIGPITQFDASAYPYKAVGEVSGFDPSRYMDAKSSRRMARFSQIALASATMAIQDAHFTITPENATQVGVVMGVAAGSLVELEENARKMLERGGKAISPFFLLSMIPNMAAFHIAHALGARGHSSTVSTACATGTQAVGEGMEVIRRGEAEVVIAGGAEAGLCELGLAGFAAMGALTSYSGDPREASRPFDKDRDGFVAAEGAAVLVLERLEHALGRGANIYAEVLGQYAACDGYHLAAPEPTGMGAVQAMLGALAGAGVRPEDVDYINAHGTSTPLNDAVETLAIKKAFGKHAYQVPISSTKSMIGHPISAAGAVEAMACAFTIRDGITHPTINYRTPDPECDLDYVPNIARRVQVKVALSNSFGLGSQNACLVLGRYP